MCCTQAKLALPAGGRAVLPALVVLEPFAAPVGDVEGRIGKDEVGLEVGVAVVVEGVAVANLAVDAADGEVHLAAQKGAAHTAADAVAVGRSSERYQAVAGLRHAGSVRAEEPDGYRRFTFVGVGKLLGCGCPVFLLFFCFYSR
jgi:hypothetical protein